MRGAKNKTMRGCAWIGLLFSIVLAPHAGAQALGNIIEIDGIRIRPGVTVEQALTAFKDRIVTQGKDPQGMDRVFISSPRASGIGKALPSLVGTLHVYNGIVVSVCRSWGPQDSTDSGLARVIFSAITSEGIGTRESATIETSVTRKPDVTIEDLYIHMEGRTVTITREERHDASDALYGRTSATWASVEECATQPGWHVSPITPNQ
jgi:hypothetical protein